MSLATPTLLRLSQYEADTINQNGDYTIDLAQNVTLYPGDQVTPYQCLIDTARPDNETIEIPNDISLSISYLYYEQNVDYVDKTTVNGNPGTTGQANSADNELYIMYHSDPSGSAVNRLIGTQAIHLPAGSYTPAGISQYITDEFSNTQASINATSLSTGNKLLIATDTGSGGGAITKFDEFSWGVDPYPFSGVPNMSGSEDSWGRRGTGQFDNKPYYLASGLEGTGGYSKSEFFGGTWVSMAPGKDRLDAEDAPDHDYHITSTGTNGVGSGCVIRIKPYVESDRSGGWVGPNFVDRQGPRFVVTIVNGGQGYQRGDEVYFDYDQFGALDYIDQLIYRLGSPDYPVTATNGQLKLIVNSIAEGTSYYEFMKLGDNPDAPTDSYRYTNGEVYWIGATEFDLEYNQNGNGIFSFNFLHTPFYKVIQNQPLQPAVLIKRAAQSNSVINVDCGVAITSLSPLSFWRDTLNFDVDSIIVKDITGKPIDGSVRSTINTIDNARTTGYLGLNGFLINQGGADSQIRKLPDPGQGNNNPIATTLTNSINAGEFKANSGAGYFLIEIEGGYKQEMVMGTDRKIQCSAVVTRQYNSFSMITAYTESALPYVHSGSPITFKRLRVRILEPNNDPPIVSPDLGSNNNVFLRVDRSQAYLEAKLSEQDRLQLTNKNKKQ